MHRAAARQNKRRKNNHLNSQEDAYSLIESINLGGNLQK
jgi:hypothetical protein